MNSYTPLVTIGIPTYNRAEMLRRSIESALCQDHSMIEVIISDNASTDNTQVVCQEFCKNDVRVKYVAQSYNIGSTANFSAVLKKASGEYFMWLADDDWLDPSYVRRCVELHETYPDTTLASGRAVFHFADGVVRHGIAVQAKSSSRAMRIFKYLALVRDNSGFYGLMRKSDLSRIKLKNVIGGDWLLVMCLAHLGKIRVYPGVVLHRSIGGASDDFKKLVRSFGLTGILQYFPYIAMGREVVNEIIRNNKIFGSKWLVWRCIMAGTAAMTLVLCQGVMWRLISQTSKTLINIIGPERSAVFRDAIRRFIGV